MELGLSPTQLPQTRIHFSPSFSFFSFFFFFFSSFFPPKYSISKWKKVKRALPYIFLQLDEDNTSPFVPLFSSRVIPCGPHVTGSNQPRHATWLRVDSKMERGGHAPNTPLSLAILSPRPGNSSHCPATSGRFPANSGDIQPRFWSQSSPLLLLLFTWVRVFFPHTYFVIFPVTFFKSPT